MTTGLILVFQRQFSEEEAFESLRASEPFADRVVGFGLGGAEVGNRPGKFARVFAECRAQGFRIVAHAGEEGGADFVRERSRCSASTASTMACAARGIPRWCASWPSHASR